MFSRRHVAHKEIPAGQTAQSPPFLDLLKRARKREAEALGRLYRQFLPGIFGYIAARITDRGVAEDLTSDVFVQMVEDIEQVRATSEAGFAAWLFQIARFTVAGYYRKRQKQPILVPITSPSQTYEEGEEALVTTHPADDPVQWSEARAEWASVVQAINQLTEDQRQVVIGRLVLGYDVATVAEIVGKRANAVKALQFRALQRLHRCLHPQREFEPAAVRHTQPAFYQEERP